MLEKAVYYNILKPVGIILLLFGLAMYIIPFPGFVCSFFIPLPILYYRVKFGRELAYIISGVAIIVVALISGAFAFNTLYILSLIVLGFILGDFLYLNYSLEAAVFVSCAAVMAMELFFLFFYSASLNKNIIEFITEYIGKNMDMTVQLYENMGANPNITHKISALADKISFIMVRILPGLSVSFSLVIAWITALSAKKLFAKNNINIPALSQSLNRWKAPEYLIWAVIICGISLFFNIGALKIVGLNGLIILMTIYFFQGIAIMSFYFEKKRVPTLFKIFLYCLVGVQNFLVVIVIGIGLFDVWINFRKINIGDKTK
jgi:uncharacterized protein YybS (DUF2232 family)